jgi:protein TonB
MRYLYLLVIALVVGCVSTKQPDYTVGTGAAQSREAAERTFAELPTKSVAGRPLDKPLKVISSPFPEYPVGFRNANIAGTVRVTFLIEENGAVSNPSVSGSPPPALVAISLNAIMRWRFEPPVSGGRPTQVRAVQEFVFRIE